MRRLGSLVLEAADAARVPGGAALAVDRVAFADHVQRRVSAHPKITVAREEATALPSPGVVATGPLTSEALAGAIARRLDATALAFFDAIAPIVSDDSLDHDRLFRASRYGKGGGDDYWNAPLTAAEYDAFVTALGGAEQHRPHHEFDRTPAQYFEGCLPIEELAERGRDTLRFGPLKPVGLVDPRTGKRPHAVVQLRQDNAAAEHFNMVGFQNSLRWGEQERVFRMIPGLEQAAFVRLGMIHRNSYINAPAILLPTFQARKRTDLLFAGQVSGVEGYLESAASGLVAGLNAARLAEGVEAIVFPPTTALGALERYISAAEVRNYQPTNMAFGLLPPLQPPVRDKKRRRELMVKRALED